ncbi:hypothetical protein Q8F55_007405 [Vanrija albida]|uniref:Uncharacterized protein n=1 Tax=Vanrija albida TaxID=181172 RepID=A0ABR3PTF1_9TREE
MTESIKSSFKVYSYVPADLVTGNKTPGKAPNSAHTEAEFLGPGVVGTAISNFTMARIDGGAKPEDGHFAGIAIFEGTILGKKGTVAWTVEGTFINYTVDAKLTLLADTATGELKGIRGTGAYLLPPPSNPEDCTGEMPSDPKDIPAFDATFEVGFA